MAAIISCTEVFVLFSTLSHSLNCPSRLLRAASYVLSYAAWASSMALVCASTASCVFCAVASVVAATFSCVSPSPSISVLVFSTSAPSSPTTTCWFARATLKLVISFSICTCSKDLNGLPVSISASLCFSSESLADKRSCSFKAALYCTCTSTALFIRALASASLTRIATNSLRLDTFASIRPVCSLYRPASSGMTSTSLLDTSFSSSVSPAVRFVFCASFSYEAISARLSSCVSLAADTFSL